MRKLHLDTDFAGDIDDLCALALVLQWPDVDLLGVTSVADEGGRRAGYIRFVLDLAGRSDVPVAAGADPHWFRFRSWPGLPDERVYWPQPVPALPGAINLALDRLEASIRQGATIVTIGPVTNLALLERRTPGILRDAHLVMMGGYVFPPGPGFPAWDSTMDFNLQFDAPSALTVLQQAGRQTLVPLAVTVETGLRRIHLPALQQAGPVARLIARQAEAFHADRDNSGHVHEALQTSPALPADLINFQHDPLACAIALGWADGVEIQALPLVSTLCDGWLVQHVDGTGKPTEVVTRVDGARFSDMWLDVVTGT